MSAAHIDDRGVVTACPSCGQQNRQSFEHLGQRARCGHCHADLAAPQEPVAVRSAAQFDAVIARSRLPVLVDFWAAWCGPCRVVAPQIETVARRNAGRLLVTKVDTDAVPDVSARLGIRSIPTLALFSDGREASRTVGAMGADAIEAFVRDAIA
jgi:thioredoxin 2